jgi:DNA-binding transcriptional LysR family regulator
LPGWTAGTSSLFLVYPGARLVPAKVRAFRDFLLEHAAGQGGVESVCRARERR